MDITERKITKIARKVSKFTVRTLRAEGIGPGKFDVLHVIRKNPGITQSGVCRITGFDKGAVARQTASLEAKGYLRREANPADGRSRCLYATAQAERLKNSKAAVSFTAGCSPRSRSRSTQSSRVCSTCSISAVRRRARRAFPTWRPQ